METSPTPFVNLLQAQTNSVIRHAVSGSGEKEIVDTGLGKYYLDWFCEMTDSVYEFYGCVFHGCPLCFDGKNDYLFHSGWKMCMMKRYNGNVKMIWERDFRKLRETDEVQHFLDTFDIVIDLEPHDANENPC